MWIVIFTLRPFCPRERDWKSPRADLYVVAKRKIPVCSRNRSLVLQLAASHFSKLDYVVAFHSLVTWISHKLTFLEFWNNTTYHRFQHCGFYLTTLFLFHMLYSVVWFLIVNWKGYRRKTVVAYFEALARRFSGETEENHENAGFRISGPKFETGISRSRSRSPKQPTYWRTDRNSPFSWRNCPLTSCAS